jgi:flagellin
LGGTAADSATALTALNAVAAQTGLTAAQLGTQAYGVAASSANIHGTLTLNSTSTNGIVFAGAHADKAGLVAGGGAVAAATSSTVSSLASMNVLTADNATKALAAIDGALTTINASRAALGAIQNRFTSVVTSLQTTSENLTASRSRIQDADFAAETANLSRAQILQQAGTAMVAQANQLPQGVLALLR